MMFISILEKMDLLLFKEAQLSENAIIINSATIGQQSKISGMAFVGDSAIIGEQVKLSDECCILDNAVGKSM